MKWMIPRELIVGKSAESETARLMSKYSTTIFRLCIGFPFIMYMFDAPLIGVINMGFLVLMLLSPLVMRITGSALLACHTLLSLLVTMLTVLALLMGGSSAPSIPFLVSAPMAAVFLTGARGATIWGVVSSLLLVMIVSMEFAGVDFPNYISEWQALFLRVAALVALIVIALLFMLQFDSLNRDALSEVQLANQRITKMFSHVEATGTALSRSAADFLGEVDGPETIKRHDGLTQQMMVTAGVGRGILEDVGDSLHKMIDQYKSISLRIQELHRQSGKISSLVKSIDNISDRLDLMALNTGIEAVHAGESGKRFQLLSDDMRRLAERVSVETSQIKAIIRDVKSHTDEMFAASMIGHSLTDEGTNKLEGMSQAFDEMYQLIEHTAAASKRMTDDTRNQITAIRDLASARKYFT